MMRTTNTTEHRRHPATSSGRDVGLRYRYLLGTILLTFLIIIAVPSQTFGAPLRVFVLGGLLQITLRMRRRTGRLGRPAWVLTAALLAATVVASAQVFSVIAQDSAIVLVASSILVLAATLSAAAAVDSSVMRGVLSVYLRSRCCSPRSLSWVPPSRSTICTACR
jgi:hypothetical protein